VLTWQLNGEYVFEPEHASEVEITFTPEDGGRTRVDLIHSKFESLTGGDSVAATVSGDTGWGALLPRFQAAAEAA
jgi:hypothetical protein